MEIFFTQHANEKLNVLLRHNFEVKKSQVIQTILEPEALDFSRKPLIIAQRKIDATHYLRVVYKKEANFIKVITFYPARVKQYARRIQKPTN